MSKSLKDYEHEGWNEKASQYERVSLPLTRQGFEPILTSFGDLRGKKLLDVCTGPGHPSGRGGGARDKFIGDAMLVFLGDPETDGDVDDAQSCLRMAIEMQHRIAGLNAEWRNGIQDSFRIRMGINTGFCNVGNFGSNDRMDYTIIGAEANLAARLQSIAKPGDIVISYETYALVRDIVVARALAPITMKGLSREVVPYVVQSVLDASGKNIDVFSEHLTGLDLYLNAGMIDATDAKHVRNVLEDALKALSKQEDA
jgi:hypothetical protein